ncbi:putative exosome complex component rrp40 isoform X2 [Dendrobium catenatum]|uniref:putative exosome complex component rrp40 isoform X2 n=1 Tax=Dendrobium catenatum TaxID=906689 RepID=UPI0009F24435|nr:putative exosome complex component rrp40 isoform X2 [Dendrobium catenatum]
MDGQLSAPTQATSLFDQTVIPGDIIVDLPSVANLRVGSGLRQDCFELLAMKVGTLRYKKPNKYWLESSHKRYDPSVEDTILGIVVGRNSENFLVDIKSSSLALLPVVAFEGGTKKNIPKLEIGSLLYVRVVKANHGTNPELSCTDASGKAAQFGPLKEGYMFDSSTGLARMLLSTPTCPVLQAFDLQRFKIVIGLNGRIWVNASTPSMVVLISNAIMASEFLSASQQANMVKELTDQLQTRCSSPNAENCWFYYCEQ